MGVFNACCGISGVSLRGRTQWVPLRGTNPCAFPVNGGYDAYGKIELYPPHTTSIDRLVAEATVLAMNELSSEPGDDFEAVVRSISHTVFNAPGRVRIGADPISYTLFDSRICEAAAREVEGSKDPSFAPWKKAALAKRSLRELAALAISGRTDSIVEPAALTLSLLEAESATIAETLRTELIAFAQQSEWIRRFGAWRPVDADGRQLSWADQLACLDAAAQKLSGHAQLTAVVAQLRAELVAEWEDMLPSASALVDVAGARAQWRPRRTGEPALLTTAAELGDRFEQLGSAPALARRMKLEAAKLSTPRLRELVSLLEAELSDDCEVLCATDGTVKALESGPSAEVRTFLEATQPAHPALSADQLVVVTPYGEHSYLIARGRRLAVEMGSAVVAGQVLAAGPLNLHARLSVLGARETLTSLVNAALALMDGAMQASDLETLFLPLVNGYVRIAEVGETSLTVGRVLLAEPFFIENDRVLAEGRRPAVAAGVFVGLSEAMHFHQTA